MLESQGIVPDYVVGTSAGAVVGALYAGGYDAYAMQNRITSYNVCYTKLLRLALRRPADLVARYGGEEFALILPDADAHGGQEVAETIRRAIEGLAIRHEDSTVGECLTISVGGITTANGDSLPNELIAAADQQLYEAKRLGRNRLAWLDKLNTA